MGKELITEEFKMMVVQYVLDGHTRRETSEKFGVSCTPIEKWVNLYKLHGAEGLLSRNVVGRQKGFDSEFRLKVLQYKQEHNLSCTQTAMHFCLDVVTVCRWDKKFREKGMLGLMWKGRMEHRITPTALRFPVWGQVRITTRPLIRRLPSGLNRIWKLF